MTLQGQYAPAGILGGVVFSIGSLKAFFVSSAPEARGGHAMERKLLHIATFPVWLVITSYNHFGTPNQINCTNTADPTDGNTPS